MFSPPLPLPLPLPLASAPSVSISSSSSAMLSLVSSSSRMILISPTPSSPMSVSWLESPARAIIEASCWGHALAGADWVGVVDALAPPALTQELVAKLSGRLHQARVAKRSRSRLSCSSALPLRSANPSLAPSILTLCWCKSSWTAAWRANFSLLALSLASSAPLCTCSAAAAGGGGGTGLAAAAAAVLAPATCCLWGAPGWGRGPVRLVTPAPAGAPVAAAAALCWYFGAKLSKFTA